MKPAEPWKILVVDDAPEVLTVTGLALESFTYRGRGVQVLEATSSAQAQEILENHSDIAVALIDVVMETRHAGLDLVHWIREVRQNSLIRLIVRTGQAGEFPAHEVILQYEINDFWEKTEVTVRKMQTSLLTCLRGYSDLLLLHQRTLALENWADGMPELLARPDWTDLLASIMTRLQGLFPERKLEAFVCRNEGTRWPMSSGIGPFPAQGAPDVLPWLGDSQAKLLLEAWNQHSLAESAQAMALYFSVTKGEDWLFYVSLGSPWTDYERHVTKMVLHNFRTLVDNRSLITALEHHQAELDVALVEKDSFLRENHHRFQTSLQVILSLIDMESTEAILVTGRTVLQGARRRLELLSGLHDQLLASNRHRSIDFLAWLAAYCDHEQRVARRSASVRAWGVPLPLELNRALPLALAVMEMVDLTWAPAYRTVGTVEAELVVSDAPRCLELRTRGMRFPVAGERENPTLEWQVLARLEAQLGARLEVKATSMTLSF